MSTAVVLAPSILVLDARAASRVHACGLIRNRWPDARVDEVADGNAALAELADGEFDLVVVALAGPAGLEAALTVRARHPACQVALLAEPGTAAERQRADAAGVRLFRTPMCGDVVEQVLSLVGWDA